MSRKSAILAIIAVLLAICVVHTGCGGGSKPGNSGRQPPPPQRQGKGQPRQSPGRPAADRGAQLFRLPMADGTPVMATAPAALFFFTTWCGYCKQVMPEIKRQADRARALGWRVYGVNVNESASLVNGFIQQYQPNFPILLDQQGMVARQYGVSGYPTFVLIDENGNIVYNGHEVPRRF